MAREKMHREEDARSLLRALYHTEADLLPDENAGTLTVRVHHQANRCNDEAIRHLGTELNQTETVFPGTQLRLVYELISNGPRWMLRQAGTRRVICDPGFVPPRTAGARLEFLNLGHYKIPEIRRSEIAMKRCLKAPSGAIEATRILEAENSLQMRQVFMRQV
jgi:hypothetical protein